jgi:hypothetical protein
MTTHLATSENYFSRKGRGSTLGGAIETFTDQSATNRCKQAFCAFGFVRYQ